MLTQLSHHVGTRWGRAGASPFVWAAPVAALRSHLLGQIGKVGKPWDATCLNEPPSSRPKQGSESLLSLPDPLCDLILNPELSNWLD